ncbi:MAG: hypothetical protein A3I44_02850 [Candidatus Sungbacteria bacterium RIFCSPLOWO2_02_FULL_51_17]|uniref:Uncharacterized protein n=1 Tax=Candidatus Sungbacteria bacterium RIFCSPHIGHO2_02_FULL_51_29 TaxID=1802273 RepID=A0A1G2KRL9_9BACT|nr:MAG: hypothetical protein A2676_00505 [Candidatus Sungbacteria bacterium RIFCSPHIGHO2_01_FULL_51_22]OHA02066.1 MAG: hypothetical protein A3C16_04340 [Candidatus Sungbacteria bacterium RIFCSPHIGHO2_02_FULL_51_29]OHA10834.1 MAG: hypothetical protein A3I44_02850 [Candidatus Sungbacteria bacterium RIFCSPLOWO2_02_FULL_51_17]
MSTQDIVLNIAVNLGRMSRWAIDGKHDRIDQFLDETERYMAELERAPKSVKFQKTFSAFKLYFASLKNNAPRDEAWAEAMLTWGNILAHRAKLA